MTVGARTWPRTVRTVSSCGRTGRVIHSSQFTGRMGSRSLISRAVATPVAIWQNASAGVRMLMTCSVFDARIGARSAEITEKAVLAEVKRLRSLLANYGS
jgi:hypothetical protein